MYAILQKIVQRFPKSQSSLGSSIQYARKIFRKTNMSYSLMSTRMIPFCFFKKIRILIYVLCNFKGIDFCADLIMIMNSQICFFIQFIIRAKYCKIFHLKFNSQRISLKQSSAKFTSCEKQEKYLKMKLIGKICNNDYTMIFYVFVSH